MRIRYRTYLFALTLCTLSSLHAQQFPMVVRGVIDLRDYNFKADGPVELIGEYEFYWNQMLNPAIEGDSGEMIYTTVPQSWFKLRKEYPEIERYGFATYRLVLLLPKKVDEITFRIEDVFSSSGYFINGTAIDYLGFPGVNKFQTVIKYNRPLVTGSVTSQQVELLIRVANFDNRNSGIVGGITLGLPEQMKEQRQKELLSMGSRAKNRSPHCFSRPAQ